MNEQDSRDVLNRYGCMRMNSKYAVSVEEY